MLKTWMLKRAISWLIVAILGVSGLFLESRAHAAPGSIIDATLFSVSPSAANTTGTTMTAVYDVSKLQGGLVGNFWFSAVGGISTYGGVSTYFIGAQENTDLAWINAERIPIELNLNPLTGTTTEPKEFSAPATKWGRFEYEIQQTIDRPGGADGGVTLYGHAFLVDSTKMIDVAPVRCGPTLEYYVNTNSGTSGLTVPKGTRKMIISIRGSDIVWTPDGTDIEGNNDYTLSQGDYLILTSREQANNFRFGSAAAGTGSTLYGTPYTK